MICVTVVQEIPSSLEIWRVQGFESSTSLTSAPFAVLILTLLHSICCQVCISWSRLLQRMTKNGFFISSHDWKYHQNEIPFSAEKENQTKTEVDCQRTFYNFRMITTCTLQWPLVLLSTLQYVSFYQINYAEPSTPCKHCMSRQCSARRQFLVWHSEATTVVETLKSINSSSHQRPVNNFSYY